MVNLSNFNKTIEAVMRMYGNIEVPRYLDLCVSIGGMYTHSLDIWMCVGIGGMYTHDVEVN